MRMGDMKERNEKVRYERKLRNENVRYERQKEERYSFFFVLEDFIFSVLPLIHNSINFHVSCSLFFIPAGLCPAPSLLPLYLISLECYEDGKAYKFGGEIERSDKCEIW